MIVTKRVGFIVMLALALGIGAACTLYETDKANKLVDAANVSIKDANEKSIRGSGKLAEMEKGVAEIEDEQGLEKLRATAKEVIADLEKARDGYKDAGSKFEDASKLKLQDKFKEYLDLKGKEMKKRGEVSDAMIGEPRALIESNNHTDYQAKVETISAKLQDLQKEANDLQAKADKILEENKAIFKKDSSS